MKLNVKLTVIGLFFSAFSCNAQKVMVQIPKDAIKLQQNKQQFEGKTLEHLLGEVKPEIKFIYGTPDGVSAAGTTLKLFFVPKEEYTTIEGRKSISILVVFRTEVNNKRKPTPVGGINTTTKEILKNYGDMIVSSIYVTGEK